MQLTGMHCARKNLVLFLKIYIRRIVMILSGP